MDRARAAASISRAGVIRFSGREGETVGDDTVNRGVEHTHKPISNTATRAKRANMLLNFGELLAHPSGECGLGCRLSLGGVGGDGVEALLLGLGRCDSFGFGMSVLQLQAL